jgi:hypothetical protein
MRWVPQQPEGKFILVNIPEFKLHVFRGAKQWFGNAETIYSYPDRDLVYRTFKFTRVAYNCKDID